MISFNMLKRYHGPRAKYYPDRKIMGKNHGFPFFYIILATALIVGPYLGYPYISENVIPFFENLVSPKNPPAETPSTYTYIATEPNLPALETKETPKEEDTPDLGDAQPQRPPKSVEPPKPNLPVVETEQIEKAEEIIKPAKGKAAPQPEEKKPAELKKKDIAIKIATFTVESNAISLKDKLDNLGHETAIREIPTILDTYKISYKNINADQFKKIQRALADQNIAYTVVKKKNALVDTESEETFVKSRFTNILNVGKSLNLKGIIEKGKKKTTVGHQVVIYTEDDKKTIDEKITYLKSVGFEPTVEKTISK